MRVYSDESQTKELLSIKTPQILDLGATYSVQDSTTGEIVGAVRRKWAKSILKDEWVLLSPQGDDNGYPAPDRQEAPDILGDTAGRH